MVNLAVPYFTVRGTPSSAPRCTASGAPGTVSRGVVLPRSCGNCEHRRRGHGGVVDLLARGTEQGGPAQPLASEEHLERLLKL